MADAPPTPPTVLVVEDEALVAMMLEDALADAGYRPVLAPDGASARPCAEGGWEDAQAVVMGLRLAGDLDGRQIVRRLRGRQPSVPVVVVTGFDPQAPEADLRGLGGPIVRLAKPFNCDEFLARLADVLAGRAAPEAPRRRASDARAAPEAPRRRASDARAAPEAPRRRASDARARAR